MTSARRIKHAGINAGIREPVYALFKRFLNMTTNTLLRYGKVIALVSFAGGILLLLLYYLTGSDHFIMAGLAFVIVIIPLNLFVFTLLLIRAYKDRLHKRRLLGSAGLLLLNVPVAALLFGLVMQLVFVMRLTIVNPTDQDITDVLIHGCQEEHFNRIRAGESKTLWIKPGGDCSVLLRYRQGANYRTETVVGYATSGQGGKLTHRIGTGPVSSHSKEPAGAGL